MESKKKPTRREAKFAVLADSTKLLCLSAKGIRVGRCPLNWQLTMFTVKHRDGRWYHRRGAGLIFYRFYILYYTNINGMDQAVLDQEGDMNTFNNRIYRINAHNLIKSNQMGKHVCLYFGVRCVWMCGSFGGAVDVNSGVREGSPSRRSYEGCATIVFKILKCFLKLERY